jgi:L-lactate dehydrogenase complex protein LldG
MPVDKRSLIPNASTMSSREQILMAIRANQPARVSVPALYPVVPDEADLPQRFARALTSIGGQAVVVSDHDELMAHVRLHYAGVSGIATTLPELTGVADVSLATITDPHGLAGLNLALIGGQLGVAENGAVWVDERHLPHRALPMIAQYVGIVIRQADIVASMHEAYRQIEVARTGFGTFIAGPSKTADIEQSLVIGAHGARGLTVYLLN